MSKENVVLGLAAAFFLLAFISIFTGVSPQILTVLSLCSALFALAQTLENNLSSNDEEQKKMFEAFNQAGNMGLSNEWMLFFKKYYREMFPSPKMKNIQRAVTVIECSSIVILVVGLAIPAKVFEIECISRVSTIVPFGFLFLSIWQIEKSKKKVQMWEEIQLFAIAFQNSQFNNVQTTQIVEDNNNG